MADHVVKNIEVSRDEKWIYGERYVDGEFVSNWIQEIPSKIPSKRGYGLPAYEAEILTRDNTIADYFEAMVHLCENPSLLAATILNSYPEGDEKFISRFVEDAVQHIPTPTQVAKFIINELMAAAKRNNIELTDVPVVLGASLLVYRRMGRLNNKQIKEMIDQELASA